MTDANQSGKIAKPFDLDGLNQLYGADTVSELLQMSVDEASGLLDQIQDGIVLQDCKAVASAAHQLKGLASTMTIERLAKLTAELEAAARQEEWGTVSNVQQRLKAEFEIVAGYISSILQKHT